MVYRRRRATRGRRYRRKSFSRRRRFYRKKRFSRRRGRRTRVHTFKRSFRQFGNVYNYYVASSKSFTLTELPNYTEFTQLFDQFKICMVKLVFNFTKNDAPINSTGTAPPPGSNILTTSIPSFQWWIDRDDVDVPTISEAAQIERNHKTMMNHPVKIVMRPNVLTMAYEGAVATAYSPAYRWLDCNDAATPHYGIKYIMDGSGQYRSPTAVPGEDCIIGTYWVDITYYCAFKNVR